MILDDLTFVMNLARQAGEILKEGWSQAALEIVYKSEVDPVTEVDRRSEAFLLRELRSATPDFGILSEESDELLARSDTRWIVDPLDGTTNFIKHIPLVAVSISLEVASEIVLGVVYNPITDELYSAQKGCGASLNGCPIHVSNTKEISKAVLASGFPYDAWLKEQDNTAAWVRFVKSAFSLRSDGSAALDLCQVACGRFDGYWERGLGAWDMAGGIIIAREAGAVVCDLSGGQEMLRRGEVLATPPALIDEMLRTLQN